MIAVMTTPASGRRTAIGVRPSRRTPRSVAMQLIAEYLRDWGLRDPELVAAESRRLIEATERSPEWEGFVFDRLDGTDDARCRQYYEAAIRQTVMQVEAWVSGLTAAPTRVGHDGQADRCAVVPQLPELLSEFPEAVVGRPAPLEASLTVRAVVPQSTVRPMIAARPVRAIWPLRWDVWRSQPLRLRLLVLGLVPRRVR